MCRFTDDKDAHETDDAKLHVVVILWKGGGRGEGGRAGGKYISNEMSK